MALYLVLLIYIIAIIQMNINIIHILILFNSKCAVTACHRR